MVSRTDTSLPPIAAENPDWRAWLDSAAEGRTPEEAALLRRACEFVLPYYAGQRVITGETVLQHALGAAGLLAGLRLDIETLVAAVLYAVPEYAAPANGQLQETFGTGIARLVDGVARMSQIQHFSEAPAGAQGHPHLEGLRKMLLAMVEDIRVVLVKLAERAQTMRHLDQVGEELRRRIAHETLELFAPLANRLGVWQIKWELEDLALRHLEPELYKEIARLLDERRIDRERYIAGVIGQLKDALRQHGIVAEVAGRPKHIYSIWSKMRRKHLDFSAIYDVRAVRVLVDSAKDCYAALGVVHHLWQPIPGEFDDYIAQPKNNFYRSLHTAVIGPEGKAVEVQIRTFEMHRHAELGVAAHWRYKESRKADARFDEKIAWLRQILEWKEDIHDAGELLEQFKTELFQDTVYVLTPQGRVIDLPQGATPLDFAYHVHTGLGHRCRGAKVDGSIVPLNYKLQNGQRVEILTAKQGAPSRDWLNPALGYLQSSRARAKVRQWFKMQSFDENVAQGRAQLDRELHRLGIASINQEKIAQRLHFHKLEDFLAAIGHGDVTQHQIAVAIQSEMPAKVETARPVATRPAAERASPSGILVEGVGNLLTKMAKCCKPAPPDAIVGYVTRDRGVTIHRRDCPAMLRLPETRRGRMLNAQWGSSKGSVFAADIEVEAYDRQGLLRDIGDLFVREKVNVTGVESLSKDNIARMRFSVEIANLEQLSKLLALIHQIPNVMTARRRA